MKEGDRLWLARKSFFQDITIHFEEYVVIRKTPKGAWITYSPQPGEAWMNQAEQHKTPISSWCKFIKDGNRKYCKTKKEALISFAARARRNRQILENRLHEAREYDDFARELCANGVTWGTNSPEVAEEIERGSYISWGNRSRKATLHSTE